MRKILTKEEKEKKESRNKLIIGLVLVAIMVISTAGFAFFSAPQEKVSKINYNSIDFILGENNLWQFNIQNFEFLTSFNPKDTENISVPVFKTINNFYGKPLFFLGQGIAREEITRNLAIFVLRIQDACIENYESMCEENAPIKNCSIDNVMIIKEPENKEDIKITQEENCIFIEASYDEQARVADALIFKILGIKQI